MKLNRIALALLVAAPLPMIANAGVTVTPLMLGYHYMNEGHDEQRSALRTQNGQQIDDKDNNGIADGPVNGGVAMKSDAYVGASIGVELTPWMGVEVEYGQTNGDAQSSKDARHKLTAGSAATNKADVIAQPWDYKQQMLMGNVYVTSDLITQNYEGAFKPYVLLGAGASKIEVEDPNGLNTNSKDTIGNLGLGAFYRMNDALSLRTELRAVHNFDNNWWEGMALAGLQVVLGGHLTPVVPVPPPVVEPTPEPVVEPVPVVVVPPAPVDTDGDGVTDDLDQCPNTPAGVVVDAKGCPQQLTEDLKMELRVFFDVNKSNIKDQYKPEIAKVADKLKEYPDAAAKIEGHTDSTGARKLNDRLSLARANAVKAMLVSDYGISADRLSTEGFAFTRPIAPNNTVEGRAMNRRVYAVITGSRTVTKMAGQ
jgi:OOP family OmpA-OmpF porin